MNQHEQLAHEKTPNNSWESVRARLRTEITIPSEPIQQKWGGFDLKTASAKSGLKGRWLMALLSVALMAVSVYEATYGIPHRSHGQYPFALQFILPYIPVLACIALGMFHLVLGIVLRANPNDKAIIAGSCSENETLVSVCVHVNGLLTGEDRGVLWTEAGFLYFYGHRSWFRIRRQDVRSDDFKMPDKDWLFQPHGSKQALMLETDNKQVVLILRELSPPNSTLWRQKPIPHKSIPVVQKFLDNTKEAGGATQLPPLSVELGPLLNRISDEIPKCLSFFAPATLFLVCASNAKNFEANLLFQGEVAVGYLLICLSTAPVLLLLRHFPRTVVALSREHRRSSG